MLKSTESRGAGTNPWRRLGKIKLGIKAKSASGSMYPKDVEYFVIPEKYQAALGQQPRELFIVLPNPTLEQNFTTKAAVYQANGGKWCSTTDEVHAKRWMDTGAKKDGKPVLGFCQIACPGTECEYRQNKKCQERGFLNFMIPATNEIGTFLLRPSSKVGIDNILAILRVVESYCAHRPKGMAGIRLRLFREPQDFYRDLTGDGQLQKVTKWIVNLELDWAQLLQDDQKLFAPIVGKTLALPAAPQRVEDAEEIEDDEELEGAAPEIPFGDLPEGFRNK